MVSQNWIEILNKSTVLLNGGNDDDTGAQIAECIFGALQGINSPCP
jgi:hypothetical protein